MADGRAVADMGTGGGTEDKGSGGGAAAGGSSEGGRVNAFAGVMSITTEHVGSGSAAPSGPACSYRLMLPPVSQKWEVDSNGDGVIDPSEERTSFRVIETGEYVDGPGRGIEQFMVATCPSDHKAHWVPSPEEVDREGLIRAAVDRARAVVPAPAVNMSPPPEFGVPANFGLWLAIADPGQINVVAQVGNVWAGVAARYESISWDMGNGAVVECDGLGTPIVDLDTDEQGPCGYTYKTTADVGVRQITVTLMWSVELVTSFSGPTMLDPATSQRTFAYEVFEIQTVGEPA